MTWRTRFKAMRISFKRWREDARVDAEQFIYWGWQDFKKKLRRR